MDGSFLIVLPLVFVSRVGGVPRQATKKMVGSWFLAIHEMLRRTSLPLANMNAPLMLSSNPIDLQGNIKGRRSFCCCFGAIPG